MTRVSIAEARRRLDELVREAAAGDDVVIETDDGAAARLVPTDAPRRRTAAEQAFTAAGDFAPYEP